MSGAGAERRAAVGAASARSGGAGEEEEEEEEGEPRQQSVRHCLARVEFGIAATPAGDARRPPHGGRTGGGGAAPRQAGGGLRGDRGRRASRSQTWPRGTYEREASRTRTCASAYMCVSTVQARAAGGGAAASRRAGVWGRGRRPPPAWAPSALPPTDCRSWVLDRAGGGAICIEWGEPPRAPSPDPRRGQAGAPRAHQLLPGTGPGLGRSLFHTRTKPPHAPSPMTELGRGSRRPPGRASGPRSRSQPASSRSVPRGWLGCPRGPGPGLACLMAEAAGEATPDSPGAREATAQAARRPLPTPHLAIVLALVKWKAKETRMERQRTRRSGQGRDDASGRGAGHPTPTPQPRSPQPAARPRGRTDTYCICQVFASYPTPAVHRWKTEPPPTQRARGLGRAGGVAGRGAGGTRTLSQGVTSRRGAPAGAGAAGEHREWPAGAAAGAGGWGPLPCDFAVSSVFFFVLFLKKKKFLFSVYGQKYIRSRGRRLSRRRRDQSGHAAPGAQARAPSPRQGTSSGRNPCKSGNREVWGFFFFRFFFFLYLFLFVFVFLFCFVL